MRADQKLAVRERQLVRGRDCPGRGQLPL